MYKRVRRCPYCGSFLSFKNKLFICKRCNKEFKKIDGIWSFTDSSYSYSDFSYDQDLLKIKSNDWKKQLNRILEFDGLWINPVKLHDTKNFLKKMLEER